MRSGSWAENFWSISMSTRQEVIGAAEHTFVRFRALDFVRNWTNAGILTVL